MCVDRMPCLTEVFFTVHAVRVHGGRVERLVNRSSPLGRYVLALLAGIVGASVSLPAQLPARPVPYESILSGPDSLLRHLSSRLQRVASGQPVHVVQIGDSHSANGFFASELASRFAVDGRISPSYFAPFHRGLQMGRMEFSPGWQKSTWLQPVDSGSHGPSGTVAITRSPGALLQLRLTEAVPEGSRLTLWWTAPEGTRAAVGIDSATPIPLHADSVDERTGMSRQTLSLPNGAQAFSLTDIEVVGDGGFRFLGASVDRHDAVMTYDVLGLSGSTQVHPLLRQRGAMTQFLAARVPDVLLVWYGTNSVVQPVIDRARFTRDYSALIDTLRAAAPAASIVLFGPPDFARPRRSCRRTDPCRRRKSRQCGPVSNPNVPIVRDLIRTIAVSRGLAFFDVYRLQGEAGGMVRGYCADPSTVNRDLVHLNETGYRELAKAFRSELIRW